VSAAEACARCGDRLEAAGDSAPPSALFEDLCLGCLEAVWDTVMASVVARRKSAALDGPPAT